MTYFIANWKMHSPPLAAWVKRIAEARLGSAAQVVLCPTFTQLAAAQMVLAGTEIALGAQDCHSHEEGAFTGDISAQMLKRAGCSYVIIGHSERRQWHHETNTQIKAKAQTALSCGLTPILCVGESQEERDAGTHEACVQAQLLACLPESGGEDMLIAYEPLWAIGTGVTPSSSAIEAMHQLIQKTLDSRAAVLYGGSVKPANAAEILALPSVDGVLVGSGSLRAEDFAAIMEAD